VSKFGRGRDFKLLVCKTIDEPTQIKLGRLLPVAMAATWFGSSIWRQDARKAGELEGGPDLWQFAEIGRRTAEFSE